MLILTGGPLIMVLAYTVRKVPFAVRSASAIVHQIDASLEEASISLGRSPLQTFLRIVVPLMLGGILSGVVLTWVTVASELSATVVLYSGPWRTMTVVMFQALEGSGAGIATAAASTLIVVTLLPDRAALSPGSPLRVVDAISIKTSPGRTSCVVAFSPPPPWRHLPRPPSRRTGPPSRSAW